MVHANTHPLPTKLVGVTVFKERVQLKAVGAVAGLEGGKEYCLQVGGAWAGAERNTLQVSILQGQDRVRLTAVRFATALSVDDVREECKKLRDDMVALDDSIKVISDRIESIQYRKSCYLSVLTKVAQAGSRKLSEEAYDPSKWAGVAKMAADGIKSLMIELRSTEATKEKLTVEKSSLQVSINNQSGGYIRRSKEVAEVVVSVLGDGALETLELELSYLARGASWEPVYDLRVDSLKKTVTMSYNALLRQSTTAAWNDVTIELSTATPQFGGDPPSLSPWRIGIDHPQVAMLSGFGGGGSPPMMMQQMMTNMMPMSACSEIECAPPPPPPRAARTEAATVSTSSTASTFTIPGKHTIPCTGETTKLGIVQHTFDGYFRYSAVPKLSPNTYLKVKCTNDTPYLLLPGKSSIFADSQLIGTSTMDLVTPNEAFWTFLGIDDSIEVVRSLVHRKTHDTSSFISGKRAQEEFKYGFILKNTKPAGSDQVEVVVWDQYPISEDKDIKVEVVEPKQPKTPKPAGQNPPFLTNELNAIEWFFDVAGNEEVKFDFAFTVETAAGDEIEGPEFH
jgi:uncharacterized protein (TIGR02231 family)